MGNSSPSARSAQSVVVSPMRRLVTPVSPKCAMWPRCAARKRAGRKASSVEPSACSRLQRKMRLRGLVEQHDALVLVHGDDGVHRRVHHRGEPRLRFVDRGARAAFARLGLQPGLHDHHDHRAQHDEVDDQVERVEPGRVAAERGGGEIEHHDAGGDRESERGGPRFAARSRSCQAHRRAAV